MRPALADRMAPRLDLSAMESAVGSWDLVSSDGGADRWEMVLKGGSKPGADGVLHTVGALFESKAHWTHATAPATIAPAVNASDWTLTGLSGEPWRGRLEVSAVPSGAGQFTAKVTVARMR